MVVQKFCVILFCRGQCCLYDVLSVKQLLIDLIIGEVYLCYYIIVDGFYRGKKVIQIKILVVEED